MIDIHSHLLFGVDDGAKNLEMSLDMIRMASEDGIQKIVCTPHCSARYEYSGELIAERLSILRNAVGAQGISIEIGIGADFNLSFDNIEKAVAMPNRFTINNKKYLLIELPDLSIPPNLDDALYRLRLAGIVPILTHPERNPTLQKSLECLENWVRDGLLLQVTASSITGKFGKRSQIVANYLLKRRLVHAAASDCHNTSTRPPLLSPAMRYVAREFGDDYASAIFMHNPDAIFQGADLPSEPVHVYRPRRTNFSWWKPSRLLRRVKDSSP